MQPSEIIKNIHLYLGTSAVTDRNCPLFESEFINGLKETGNYNFDQIISEHTDWNILFHFSPLRSHIIQWMPFRKNQRILEIGSGCGAISEHIRPLVAHLDCIDQSYDQCLINAYRNQGKDHLSIYAGTFSDFEQELTSSYDYILLPDPFGSTALPKHASYEALVALLNSLKAKLAPGGQIILTFDNKYGLKYWAGCNTPGSGLPFAGLEGNAQKMITLNQARELGTRCGLANCDVRYPYPDHLFTKIIYSDARQPKPGDLDDNFRNFDSDRLLVFNETLAYNQLIRDGLFPMYSNSYLVILGGSN